MLGMMTIRTNEPDETKHWLAEQQKVKQYGIGYTPLTVAQGIERYVIRESKKLYSTNKYRADGSLYSEVERPWLFTKERA